MIKIAMIQMQVVFSEPEQNLAHAEELVAQAAAGGAQICVLPECMDLGWGNPQAVQLAQPIPGTISQKLCEIAQKYQVHLVSGLTEREGEKIYNTALLVSEEGKILIKHRKINILTGVEDVYAVGDRVSVAETVFGKIGIDICADNAVTSLCIGHTLARMGAQILLSPCAWAVEPDYDYETKSYGDGWHTSYARLSSLYEIPVLGVSNVGRVAEGSWMGWSAIGNSIAYDCNGQVLAVLPYGETAECVKIVEAELGTGQRSGTALSQYVADQML